MDLKFSKNFLRFLKTRAYLYTPIFQFHKFTNCAGSAGKRIESERHSDWLQTARVNKRSFPRRNVQLDGNARRVCTRLAVIVVTNLKRGVEFSHVLYRRSPTTATWRPIVGRLFAEPLRVDTRSSRCEHDRNYRYRRAWMRARLAAESVLLFIIGTEQPSPGEVCTANS